MISFKQFLIEREQIGDKVREKAIKLLGTDDFESASSVPDEWLELAKQDHREYFESALGTWHLDALRYKGVKFVRILPPKGSGKAVFLIAKEPA